MTGTSDATVANTYITPYMIRVINTAIEENINKIIT
jgi:hypothetical protein